MKFELVQRKRLVKQNHQQSD